MRGYMRACDFLGAHWLGESAPGRSRTCLSCSDRRCWPCSCPWSSAARAPAAGPTRGAAHHSQGVQRSATASSDVLDTHVWSQPGTAAGATADAGPSGPLPPVWPPLQAGITAHQLSDMFSVIDEAESSCCMTAIARTVALHSLLPAFASVLILSSTQTDRSGHLDPEVDTRRRGAGGSTPAHSQHAAWRTRMTSSRRGCWSRRRST